LLHRTVFIPACEEAGYHPFRVDRSEPHGTITDAILSEIHACQFMIADLTYARQSVYFEVGVAHGLGIPVLLTCRQDHFRGKSDAEKVHFDLEQFMTSYWTLDGSNFVWMGGEEMKPKARLEVMKTKLANAWPPRLAPTLEREAGKV
jgi:nucleoside 2-deoxyribosyltransferase